MTYESLRCSPAILRRLQRARMRNLITLPPINPVRAFGWVTNSWIVLPLRIISNAAEQVPWLASLAPILKLHLSSLTISLQRSADGSAPSYIGVASFATRINCLLAPRLCLQDHHEMHYRCVHHLLHHLTHHMTLLRIVCNVRIIVVHFGKLSVDAAAEASGFRWVSWMGESPTRERSKLKLYGWNIKERITQGGTTPQEVRFVWKKMEFSAWDGYRKVDGRLLKGIGERKAGRR